MDDMTNKQPAPRLITIADLSKILSRSISAIERDQAAGRLPQPLKLGGSKRWRMTDIESWIAAGCPKQTQSR